MTNVGKALRLFAEIENVAAIFELFLHRGVLFYNEGDFINAQVDLEKAEAMAEGDIQRLDIKHLLRLCRDAKTPVVRLDWDLKYF